MKRCSIQGLSVILIFFAALSISVAVCAAPPDNAGFRKDVPTTLKERFGICEEFLDVKWIDKSKSIGLLKTDIVKNGRSEQRFLIVHLEKPGSKAFAVRGNGIFYEISEKDYSSGNFERFLRGANIRSMHKNVFLTVAKGGKSERFPQEPLPFEAFVAHQNEFPNRSFSDFSKTVCVAYPDEKKVFVIEAKKPFLKARMDDKVKQDYDAVKNYAKEKCGDTAKGKNEGCDLGYLNDSYALDVNGDGKDDYIFLVGKANASRYMLLSSKDRTFAREVKGCLGSASFFYGYADLKAFHLGRCSR